MRRPSLAVEEEIAPTTQLLFPQPPPQPLIPKQPPFLIPQRRQIPKRRPQLPAIAERVRRRQMTIIRRGQSAILDQLGVGFAVLGQHGVAAAFRFARLALLDGDVGCFARVAGCRGRGLGPEGADGGGLVVVVGGPTDGGRWCLVAVQGGVADGEEWCAGWVLRGLFEGFDGAHEFGGMEGLSGVTAAAEGFGALGGRFCFLDELLGGGDVVCWRCLLMCFVCTWDFDGR